MKYCSSCVLPDTRPGLVIQRDGVCNACHAARVAAKEIRWDEREAAFRSVVSEAKKRSKGYDCLIPVSGGKDSTWQVLKCLEYGLNPLAVTWKPPGRTELGRYNLERLVDLGVDHIDYQINPRVERTFMLRALERFGSTAIPMHLALFSIPLTIGVKYEIPLIVWGENSADEYGTKDESLRGHRLTNAWLKVYGVSNGTSAEDWIDEDLTRQKLTPYFGPSDEELEARGIHAVFLGYYFGWDPEMSLEYAKRAGFQVREEGPKTGYWNYADIDDDFLSIHHYLKWYKFGFTRLFDNLSVEIRRGRMSRPQAIEIIRQYREQTPYEDIERFCVFVGITQDRFFEIIEKFRSPVVWQKSGGVWTIPDFIISDWDWASGE